MIIIFFVFEVLKKSLLISLKEEEEQMEAQCGLLLVSGLMLVQVWTGANSASHPAESKHSLNEGMDNEVP